MRFVETKFSGCYQLLPRVFNDERGRFVKTFHKDIFKEYGLETDFVEEYHSLSKRGVLRGLHFQTPPADHAKLVYCIMGEVIDAVVDLRVDSTTYGQYELFNLDSEQANALYIPRGLAHGFYTVSDSATMVYNVTSVHSPENDAGILWNSVGIPWPEEKPIVSTRDNAFPALSDYISPFRSK